MPMPSPPGRLTERIADGAAVATLAIVALLAALTFRDYGLGWDDYTHSQYGALLLDLYGSGFTDRRALSFVNLYAYGGGFDMAAALLAKVLPFGLFETRRLAGALVGLVGLGATWRLGRRVGGPLAGLLSLVLLATCPLYYGHMFINAKDGPFAAAMALLMLGLVRTFEDYPRVAPPTGAFLGIGIGLAIGSRILGGFAAIEALIVWLAIVAIDTRASGWRPALGRAGAFLLALLPALVLAYAVMALVWPWSVVAPLNPLRAVDYFSHFFEKPWRELFQGEFILVPEMPRRYVAQLFALKLPEIMLALGLCGAIGAFAAAFNRRLTAQRRAVLLLLALAATFPIALTVALRPAMYNGIRHFVFVTPAIAAVAGLAAARLIERARAWRPAAAAVGLALFAIGCALPAIEMAKLHPYEYTYFNRIEGGEREARSRYMLDYWGLSLKQASEALLAWIAANHQAAPGREYWKIAVCGPHPPAQVALGPHFDVVWDPGGADFAMSLGEFYCAQLDAPVVAEIKRDGVVYARVYDIRGRSFSTLLTLPAP
ncbi:MAG TPA: glycosyltransferase family 39 protein [Xanthobacteraceae bacterium]|nr:glycosyltransferase family 39 protein [Xanthobacteraceae bacterium]